MNGAADALEQAADVAISRVAYVVAEDLLTRAVQLRRAAGSSPEAQQAELDALLRLLEVMQATRYFAGTDRDALHRAQDLALELGQDDVHRTLKWSEWAALSTTARIAEAQPMAEQYLARWGDDPRPQVRAAAHTLFGVDEWTRGRIGSAMGHLDEAAALLADAPPPEDAFEGGQRVIAHSFGLYCHAAHGDQTPEEALAGFDFMLGMMPPEAVPAVCAFGCAVAAVHTRWEAVDRLVRHALELDPASQFAFFGGQLLMFRGLVEATQRRLRHRDRQLRGGPLAAALSRRSIRDAELSGAARRGPRPGGSRRTTLPSSSPVPGCRPTSPARAGTR